MSLRDGTSKMSKSDASDQSRINLTDSPDVIARKIRRARTDPEPLPGSVDGLANRPEADNLVTIYAALTNGTRETVCSQFANAAFSVFKEALTEIAVQTLSPITTEMQRLMDDPGYVDSVLRDGAERADQMAAPILREAQNIVGFLHS